MDDDLDDDLARALTHLPIHSALVLRVEPAEAEDEDARERRKILSAVIVKTTDGGEGVAQCGVSVELGDYVAFESLVIEMLDRYCLVIEAETEKSDD